MSNEGKWIGKIEVFADRRAIWCYHVEATDADASAKSKVQRMYRSGTRSDQFTIVRVHHGHFRLS